MAGTSFCFVFISSIKNGGTSIGVLSGDELAHQLVCERTQCKIELFYTDGTDVMDRISCVRG